MVRVPAPAVEIDWVGSDVSSIMSTDPEGEEDKDGRMIVGVEVETDLFLEFDGECECVIESVGRFVSQKVRLDTPLPVGTDSDSDIDIVPDSWSVTETEG